VSHDRKHTAKSRKDPSYEYFDIHYDEYNSTKEEIAKLYDFIFRHGIADKDYLVKVMDMLSDSLYNVFSKKNIEKWASLQGVKFEKVLFQKGSELSPAESQAIETQFFKPLKDKNVPAKSITKIANINYMKVNGITADKHKYFYYINKFTRQSDYTTNIGYVLLTHNQVELSRKMIDKLKSNAVDPIGGNYHSKNKSNLEYIIKSIASNNALNNDNTVKNDNTAIND